MCVCVCVSCCNINSAYKSDNSVIVLKQLFTCASCLMHCICILCSFGNANHSSKKIKPSLYDSFHFIQRWNKIWTWAHEVCEYWTALEKVMFSSKNTSDVFSVQCFVKWVILDIISRKTTRKECEMNKVRRREKTPKERQRENSCGQLLIHVSRNIFLLSLHFHLYENKDMAH